MLEDTQVATVMFAGQLELIEHIHLLSGAFIQVGGVFTAVLQDVSLVDCKSITYVLEILLYIRLGFIGPDTVHLDISPLQCDF